MCACGPGLVEGAASADIEDVAEVSDVADVVDDTSEETDEPDAGDEPPLACLWADRHCAPGEVCARVPGAQHRICREPGPIAVGKPCSLDAECVSGLCLGARCASTCLSHSDCFAGPEKYCVQFDGRLTCRPAQHCDDDEHCQDPDGPARCLADGCSPAPCQVSSDCPAGSCVVEAAVPNLAECRLNNSACTGSAEWVVGGPTLRENGQIWCASDEPCTPEVGCQTPDTTCTRLGDLDGKSGDTWFCARIADGPI